MDFEKLVKLIDCEIASNDDKREKITKFTLKEIEYLSEFEHDERVKECLSLGWTYGSYKDVEKKISPYIVPWEKLTEDIKDYYRNRIINVPNIRYAG